jgi:hypothetical protein
MTDDEALSVACILDGAAETHAALVALMKAIARYGRPSSLPHDVRGAWDDCERIVGEDAASELLAIASQAMHERGQRLEAKAAKRRAAPRAPRHAEALRRSAPV